MRALISTATILSLSLALAGCDARKDEPVRSAKPSSVSDKQASNAEPIVKDPPKVDEPTVAELFPLKAGNSWTYEAEVDGKAVGEMIWSVAKVSSTARGAEITMELASGASVEQQTWLQTGDGLYQVSGGSTRVRNEPPQPIFKKPLTQGARYTYSGTGHTVSGDAGVIETASDVLGFQDVGTEAGRFFALAVETKSIYTEAGETTRAIITSWYAPGIGLVQYRMEVEGAGSSLLRLRKTNVR